MDYFTLVSDYILFVSCLFILAGCFYITFKTRFVQIRFFSLFYKMIRDLMTGKSKEESEHTIAPYKALLTAMSTTLGISTIVAPIIAIHMGGPGALLGFLLTAFFGSAATYTEVRLSIEHRRKLDEGIMGGPMQYIRQILSPFAAKWYAVSATLLMTAWSSAQSNQLAAILDSPLLGDYRIPTIITGFIIAIIVLMTLLGGVKRVSSISAKLVPLMFCTYLGSCLLILLTNTDQFGRIFSEIFRSAFSPYAMASGTLVGGLSSSLRWGIFKGIQSNEAGIGTQAIPHSMAETEDGEAQGMLAIFSTYTAGIVAFLSGFVALITETWQDPDLPLGISMVAASFQLYYSSYGVLIIAICTALFGFGTILGNSFNGSQCFGYLTENKKISYYFIASSLIVLLGAIADAKTLWSMIDLVLVAMILPHMTALIVSVYKIKLL